MICHITVHTTQVQETAAFYDFLLGLPITRTIPTPAGDILFLGVEETKLELVPDSKAKKICAQGISIGFLVASLNEKLALLDSKGISHSPVISPDLKTNFAFFTDLNGCEIQLMEQV